MVGYTESLYNLLYLLQKIPCIIDVLKRIRGLEDNLVIHFVIHDTQYQ